MVYKDLHKDGKGIFETVFKKLYTEQYDIIFAQADPVELDMYALTTFSGKKLISAITPENYTYIISSVINVNVHSWVKQAEAMGVVYDILKPSVRVTEFTETASRDENRTNDKTNSKKYFDDAEFTDGTKETAETQQGWQETKSRTSSDSGIGAGVSVSGVIQKEVTLRELNIRTKVIYQLIDEITLSIY